jgi:hypothetical protein
MALNAMQQYLTDGSVPPSRLKVVPHLVMRSNLDLLLERLAVDEPQPSARIPAV